MAKRLPFALRFYQLAAVAGAPAAPQVLARRLNRGKEDPQRLPERRGEASLPRPNGPLIWMHGASVGEMLAMIPLIEQLHAQHFFVLVTTGTVTAAALAEQRLPDGTLHQFIPLDAPRFVQRFLDYWRPGLALFVESDLWPNLILASADRRIPMILINGRLSQRSFNRWQYLPRSIEALLSRFDLCLAQSNADAERYAKLGAPRVAFTGNLKLDAAPPPADEAQLRRLKALLGARPVIAAASTHPGEDSAIITAHRRLRARFPRLLTLIAPRHPQNGDSIVDIAKVAGLAVAQRSQRGQPMPDIDIYVADTVGELGLIYRLAPIVFVGGSLIEHGGQNPIEAIRLGGAVLHGPHVWNFDEIYATLDAGGGAKRVDDEESLTEQLAAWLADPAARREAAEAGAASVEQIAGALRRTLAALNPYLMQLRLEQPHAPADA